MNLNKLENDFKRNTFNNEDDIKVHFHTDIIKPLLDEFNPTLSSLYKSEDILDAGGRTDATFQNVSFELKKEKYFNKKAGIEEALYGRNNKDHGLYDYIISNSKIDPEDSKEIVTKKILSGVGVGFDGDSFIFARFVPSPVTSKIDTAKLKVNIKEELNVQFSYEKKNFSTGLKRLVLLIKQTSKITLSKANLTAILNPKSDYVRNSIMEIYNNLNENLDRNNPNFNNRVQTLFDEWDRIFGTMYGDDEDATDFTEVSSKIRELYYIEKSIDIDSKRYLFSMQTFFNIFLKLLVYSFLAQLVDPSFTCKSDFTKDEINRLFDGQSTTSSKLVNNFFESHFLEWFTFTGNIKNPDDSFDVKLVNESMDLIAQFDLGTFVLKPEAVQDILQEVYMGLIPSEMRHLMGEYFSPDWVVEHALDMVGYTGDITKSLIDPSAGSGPFITQSIKRIIKKQNGVLSKDDILKITQNIVAFDINPISVVSAKANYIIIIFSAYFDNYSSDFGDPVNIPVFIADSVLSPVVYTEENDKTLKLDTTVGKIEIPKFESFQKGNEFLKILSKYIDDRTNYQIFENIVMSEKLIKEEDRGIVQTLFSRLSVLHRSSKDSFWPIIFRNSFAPVMIGNKFDYVVGNPPWIAWKAMSKSYRSGTLSIWKSYGIFEKNAYDKKTTHDDFAMAVTYVSIDQYLKKDGDMVFLLPASFLKSTKGGEGFRKFEIIRKGQNIPFAVEEVHDFSGVSLFNVATVAIKFKKGKKMQYPMDHYRFYNQIGKKSKIDSHASWSDAKDLFTYTDCTAQPVYKDDSQSAWLTLDDMTFANNVLDTKIERHYKGRKGIEPAGAKGVYILKHPKKSKDGYLIIENDISRQRRKDIIEKGINKGEVEEKYVYPMLGGRNISRWYVKSCEFMLVPHTEKYKYGVPELILSKEAPKTFQWLYFYHDELLATRIQNGKFFNKDTQPFYRLDNVGEYTYSPYKVLWKEQTGSMSAVVASTYENIITNYDKNLFSKDKIVVVDSKVLMLSLNDEMEAYYVCGIINAPCIREVVDGYAISTNRGIDVLKNLAIKKFDLNNDLHSTIAQISKDIHIVMKNNDGNFDVTKKEKELNDAVLKLFSSDL